MTRIVPYALLLRVARELGPSPVWMATLAYGFLLGRALHAYGMLAPAFRLRQAGAGITYLFELVAISFLLVELARAHPTY